MDAKILTRKEKVMESILETNQLGKNMDVFKQSMI